MSSGLLSIPVELRLQIYEYVLATDRAVTFSLGKLYGDRKAVNERLGAASQDWLADLPEDCIPLIHTGYDEALLRIKPLVDVAANSPRVAEGDVCCYHYPILSIHLVCRQIHSELIAHFSSTGGRKLDLFVQYPYGLAVFDKIGSSALLSARSVSIVGEYIARRDTTVGDPPFAHTKHKKVHPQMPSERGARDLSRSLESTVEAILRPRTTDIIDSDTELHMRMSYPGIDAYERLWGDVYSPISIVLQHSGAAEIQLEIARESWGTNVYLCARRSRTGKRSVDTTWVHWSEQESHPWEIDREWPVVQSRQSTRSRTSDILTPP